MYLSGNDKVVRGKKGSAGVHIFKTTKVFLLHLEEKYVEDHSDFEAKTILQAVIVATYTEPIVPEQVEFIFKSTRGQNLSIFFQCASTTEKLGDYLISVGY